MDGMPVYAIILKSMFDGQFEEHTSRSCNSDRTMSDKRKNAVMHDADTVHLISLLSPRLRLRLSRVCNDCHTPVDDKTVRDHNFLEGILVVMWDQELLQREELVITD